MASLSSRATYADVQIARPVKTSKEKHIVMYHAHSCAGYAILWVDNDSSDLDTSRALTVRTRTQTVCCFKYPYISQTEPYYSANDEWQPTGVARLWNYGE
jgi:hypothetical protein